MTDTNPTSLNSSPLLSSFTFTPDSDNTSNSTLTINITPSHNANGTSSSSLSNEISNTPSSTLNYEALNTSSSILSNDDFDYAAWGEQGLSMYDSIKMKKRRSATINAIVPLSGLPPARHVHVRTHTSRKKKNQIDYIQDVTAQFVTSTSSLGQTSTDKYYIENDSDLFDEEYIIADQPQEIFIQHQNKKQRTNLYPSQWSQSDSTKPIPILPTTASSNLSSSHIKITDMRSEEIIIDDSDDSSALQIHPENHPSSPQTPPLPPFFKDRKSRKRRKKGNKAIHKDHPKNIKNDSSLANHDDNTFILQNDQTMTSLPQSSLSSSYYSPHSHTSSQQQLLRRNYNESLAQNRLPWNPWSIDELTKAVQPLQHPSFPHSFYIPAPTLPLLPNPSTTTLTPPHATPALYVPPELFLNSYFESSSLSLHVLSRKLRTIHFDTFSIFIPLERLLDPMSSSHFGTLYQFIPPNYPNDHSSLCRCCKQVVSPQLQETHIQQHIRYILTNNPPQYLPHDLSNNNNASNKGNELASFFCYECKMGFCKASEFKQHCSASFYHTDILEPLPIQPSLELSSQTTSPIPLLSEPTDASTNLVPTPPDERHYINPIPTLKKYQNEFQKYGHTIMTYGGERIAWEPQLLFGHIFFCIRSIWESVGVKV